jgi:hypothetical protein
MRTESEIADEVQRLRDLLPKIWEGCEYASLNRTSIQAEIAVLEKRMMERDVEAAFGNDESPEFQAYIFDSALRAFKWMVGKWDGRSSDDWAALLG